jgi:hypothetical protein
VYLTQGSSFVPPHQQGDSVSEQQQQERLAAFNALGPLPMALVPNSDIAGAVDNMQLSEEAKQSLLADLAKTSAVPSTALPSPAPQAAANGLRLAWVTLWDTDAEDGDIVRIDSRGYSRTIVLKKAPVTFAIPVPASGIINVTGVHDGEGGGITVGLASGASKAVFPIMSEGQVLGLRVKVN